MRKIRIFVIGVFLLLVILAGCDFPYGGPTQHTFLQSRENIVKVEICYLDEELHFGTKPDTLSLLYVLSEEEIDILWDELSGFPAFELRHANQSFGDLFFVVSYSNGEKELIGYAEIPVVNADGIFDEYRGHLLDNSELLSQIFARYVNPKILMKVSECFKASFESP